MARLGATAKSHSITERRREHTRQQQQRTEIPCPSCPLAQTVLRKISLDYQSLHTFPAPLWPSKAVICPEYMVRSSLSTASFDPPVEFLYSLVRPVVHVSRSKLIAPRNIGDSRWVNRATICVRYCLILVWMVADFLGIVMQVALFTSSLVLLGYLLWHAACGDASTAGVGKSVYAPVAAQGIQDTNKSSSDFTARAAPSRSPSICISPI